MTAQSWSAADWVNHGGALLARDPALAARLLARGIQAAPDHAVGYFNLGISLHQQARIDAAIRAYQVCLDRPDAPLMAARNNLSQDLLLAGRWAEGWALYQHRFQRKPGDYPLMASERFDLSAVDRPVDIAFANSLFSHLTLNSIVTCLLQLRQVLQPRGVFYATFFALDQLQSWLAPQRRDKWGHTFDTFAHQDPYHYPPSLLKALARDVGFRMDLVADFGHPTQTMARFRRRWR